MSNMWIHQGGGYSSNSQVSQRRRDLGHPAVIHAGKTIQIVVDVRANVWGAGTTPGLRPRIGGSSNSQVSQRRRDLGHPAVIHAGKTVQIVVNVRANVREPVPLQGFPQDRRLVKFPGLAKAARPGAPARPGGPGRRYLLKSRAVSKEWARPAALESICGSRILLTGRVISHLIKVCAGYREVFFRPSFCWFAVWRVCALGRVRRRRRGGRQARRTQAI